jgi:hypothetical protein
MHISAVTVLMRLHAPIRVCTQDIDKLLRNEEIMIFVYSVGIFFSIATFCALLVLGRGAPAAEPNKKISCSQGGYKLSPGWNVPHHHLPRLSVRARATLPLIVLVRARCT